jgi:hypothetical protein
MATGYPGGGYKLRGQHVDLDNNSNVDHWTYAYSIGSNGQLLCPLDIYMSIRSNGQLKCPLDIRLSNGSIGSNGPLAILTLPSHRPATCMGSMSTYDVIRVNLFTALPNVQWTYSCPLDPMDRIKCPLDISMSIGSNGQLNVHWTHACPMDPLDPMDHWTYSLCHHTRLLPAWGRCQPMTSFK